MTRVIPSWITESKWNAMCSAHMDVPQPLEIADLSKPFVYDREFGVFPVSNCFHQTAMSLLLAWQYNLERGGEVAKKLDLPYSLGTSDYYLFNTVGTAFMSSVGNKVLVGKRGHLNEKELDYFGVVTYLKP